MKERDYNISLYKLTEGERLNFPESFKEYSEAVIFLLRTKESFLFEDDLIEEYKDHPFVEEHINSGKQGIDAIRAAFPHCFVHAGKRRRKKGEGLTPVWFDLWSDSIITPQDELYDLFFVYKLRHTDLMEMDYFLNYSLENYYENNTVSFLRFLKLALRKHSKKLLQPEQIETINEWIAEQEKTTALSGIEEPKTKGKIKRERDDKVTLLNQEQTALLIHCLRKTKIILIDEFLNNKEAGQAFSILTGYSADTLRQNLNKSETANIATIKNVEVVEKALKEVLKYIDKQVKPEQ